MLSVSAGMTGYAANPQTAQEITAEEALAASPEILENDWNVLRSIPVVLGTDVRTIGAGTLSDTTMEALQAAVQTYTNEGRVVSFLVLDLLSGRTIYCNTGLKVYSASCIKAPYIISCLAAGNASTEDMYKAGHVSDNAAYSRIRKQYGRACFEQWLAACGVNTEIAAHNYCHLTAAELARMWLSMYSYIEGDEKDSAFARKTLRGSLNSVIAAGPGSTRTAYSKAGWISDKRVGDYNVYNCGGIVMDDNPYIMVIVSNVPGTTAEAQTLADVLDAAHDEIVQ